MKKTLQFSNIIALIITVVMNYLSNTGIFNGNTMATVSAKYQNSFTPSGYAFSIWGIIYLGLAAFAIHQSKGLFKKVESPSVVTSIGWLFVISCAANCAWILAWLYDFTGLSVIIMAILLFSLLRIVITTRMELDTVPFKKVALEWWPFSIYTGWILVAIIANIAAYLTKINWNGFGISGESWTIIMICLAAVINLYLIWNRNMRETALAGAWGITAVAVVNWNEAQSVAYTAVIAAAFLVLNTAVHAYRNRGNFFILK
ncbi:tryptophan-rich sensory protein [Dyadobacter flavalbus]|uniref:Tryptophan-rich sensory protein n=1 Tax=Dyadobacter flavalbus TaxID=2579942 RepID=A0A5M8QP16_9BACT|nr:tryptophan-rich sensory protein [Dyadobacter flavalbus]KAA6437028.1 tryptophan-rich sensory protein [Dyadobacter flavalbus]